MIPACCSIVFDGPKIARTGVLLGYRSRKGRKQAMPSRRVGARRQFVTEGARERTRMGGEVEQGAHSAQCVVHACHVLCFAPSSSTGRELRLLTEPEDSELRWTGSAWKISLLQTKCPTNVSSHFLSGSNSSTTNSVYTVAFLGTSLPSYSPAELAASSPP